MQTNSIGFTFQGTGEVPEDFFSEVQISLNEYLANDYELYEFEYIEYEPAKKQLHVGLKGVLDA